MINGIVFDFNGTLFFDSEYHLQVFDKLKYELTGEHMDMSEMESTCAGVPNVEIFKRLSNGKLTRKECELYSKRKEELYRKLVAETPGGPHLCPGTEQLFSYLKNSGLPFTIASASIKENIDFFIEIFHLDQWMDPALIVYDDGSYFDKTAMFEEAFRRLKTDGKRIIVEDSVSGVRCAALCNAEVIAIDSLSLREKMKNTTAVIDYVSDMSDVLTIIKKENQPIKKGIMR